ncbi:MAG: hypothetical protein IKG47_05535 [Oscillospiraceae bacterium]|nr:hypothetical protein [Oscillospiraceae bacterium]
MKKYRIRIKVPVEKRTLFGRKTVYEERTVEVDRETYLKWKDDREEEDEGFSLEEMIFYDDILDDD